MGFFGHKFVRFKLESFIIEKGKKRKKMKKNKKKRKQKKNYKKLERKKNIQNTPPLQAKPCNCHQGPPNTSPLI
jgi:DNA gyrase/topoisomerase IV subunit B